MTFQPHIKTVRDRAAFILERLYPEICRRNLQNEDIYLNATQLIRKNGYQVEEYEVETEDGYLLLLVRIRGSGPTVFLMHGILLSSDDWVTAGTDIGIGYLLAAEGFDVWMGNARGNKHSRKHRTLSPDTAEFWNFSYHEIGIYDLPAMIDYTLAVTKQEKLIYVGHSQGTTTFFVMASERQEYNSKISVMIALAPIGAPAHVKSLVLLLIRVITLDYPQIFFGGARSIGIQEIFPSNVLTHAFTTLVCSQLIFQKTICRSIIEALVGYDESQVFYPSLSTVYAHIPSGSSTKQFEHFGQGVSSRHFAKFDYGKVENFRLYSNSTPPEYPLQNITTPIAFFYGLSDLFAPPEDVLHLQRQLPNIIETYEVPFNKFSHVDFVYAKDLKKLVFARMLEIIILYV
ncbi:lipase 1-like [Bombyx mandarina]|uniref:Lipase n=1 Tax=Bombyx mandarina TaxID=7092 RepID=A0A6J2JCL5_BOMMA|nr:lipase 1-like [Bombyx mandarina]